MAFAPVLIHPLIRLALLAGVCVGLSHQALAQDSPQPQPDPLQGQPAQPPPPQDPAASHPSPDPNAPAAEPVSPPVETGSVSEQATKPEVESRFAFGAMLGFTHVSEDHSSLSVSNPLLQGRVALWWGLLAEVDWGFVLARDNDAGFSARTGNPWIKAWYRRSFGDLLLQGGLGVTIPLATVSVGPEGRQQRALYNHSAALWGMADIWRWSPGRLAVPIVEEATYPIYPGQILSAELAVAPLQGVRAGEKSTDVCAQLKLAGRFRLVSTFWVGGRLQGVLLPSTGVDRLQTAVALRLEWTPRLGRFFLEGLMNLDEPVGFSGRGTRTWGIFLGKELAR